MSQTPEKSGPVESDRMLHDASFCIVAARFNSDIVEVLVAGAREALERHGVAESAIDVLHVPGAFELPLAALKAAQSRANTTASSRSARSCAAERRILNMYRQRAPAVWAVLRSTPGCRSAMVC